MPLAWISVSRGTPATAVRAISNIVYEAAAYANPQVYIAHRAKIKEKT